MDDELFELCKQVYEATRWRDTLAVYEQTDGIPLGEPYIAYPELERKWGLWGSQELKKHTPLYTTDYLLEKLLPITPVKFYRAKNGNISLFWEPIEPVYEDMMADTPLKALLRLTLALQEAKLL